MASRFCWKKSAVTTRRRIFVERPWPSQPDGGVATDGQAYQPTTPPSLYQRLAHAYPAVPQRAAFRSGVGRLGRWRLAWVDASVMCASGCGSLRWLAQISVLEPPDFAPSDVRSFRLSGLPHRLSATLAQDCDSESCATRRPPYPRRMIAVQKPRTPVLPTFARSAQLRRQPLRIDVVRIQSQEIHQLN